MQPHIRTIYLAVYGIFTRRCFDRIHYAYIKISQWTLAGSKTALSLIFIYIYILRFYPIFFYEQWEGRKAYRFHFLRFAFSFFYCFVTVQFIYTHHENKMTKTLGYRWFSVYSVRATDGRENSEVNPSPPTVPTQPMSMCMSMFLHRTVWFQINCLRLLFVHYIQYTKCGQIV